MAFNFGSLANTKPANTTSYLKPYRIYPNVTIKSAEIKEGTSSNGNAWKSLVITFGNDEGIHSDSIFYLDEKNPKDFDRGSQDMPNGGKRELPSPWERLSDKMAAIGFAFFPEDFAKLQKVASKITSFDELMKYFKQAVDKNIDKNPTNMKLVGRNSNGRVYATLPNCTGIAQAKDEKRATENKVKIGDWYTWMVSPFNDNPTKLAFSDWEQRQANEYYNAKPTDIGNSSQDTDSVNNFDSVEKGSEEDIDFESLL